MRRILYTTLYETDENGKRVVKKVERLPKFCYDDDGLYYECEDLPDGSLRLYPAPVWAGNINPYLFEGPNIFIESHKKPLFDVPILRAGGKPVDGGFLTLTDEQKQELLKAEPQAEPFIRQYMNGNEFINNIPRWCLWLVGAEPSELRKCPRVLKRVGQCRDYRLKSKKDATRRAADTPGLFAEITECKTNYLAIPKVSSGTRQYIPIGWLAPDVIAGDKLFTCDNATLYQFGILNSSVHMAWCRTIGQHLGTSHSYANTFNYNAFPWPSASDAVIRKIERTAQGILDARKLYPKSTLADLYDVRSMPVELRKAHRANDEAVVSAYGFKRRFQDEREHEEDIVINLMYMYKDITGCREFYESYPNLRLWERVYGKYTG